MASGQGEAQSSGSETIPFVEVTITCADRDGLAVKIERSIFLR